MSKEFNNTTDGKVNSGEHLKKTSYKENKKERKYQIKEEKRQERKAKSVRKKINKRTSINSNSNSYIDSPNSSARVKRPNQKRKISLKRLIVIFIAVLILFVLIFVVLNADLISCENASNFVQYGILNNRKDESFPVNLEGASISNGNFSRMGNDLCYASDTKFSIVNTYGREVYSNLISFINPILASSDEYSLVYSLGDKDFFIASKKGLVYQSESKDKILVASINNNGEYALVTESDGYLSKLYVYNKDNEQIYAYSFADFYITSVDLSENGRRIALSGVSALHGKEISAIYVLDISKEDPVCFEKIEGEILYKIGLLGNNYGCAIGKTASYSFKINSKEFNKIDYEGKTMSSFAISRNSSLFYVALSRSGDGRNCDIVSVDNNGKIIGTNETELQITSLSAYKNRVLALSSSDVYLFAPNGNQISKVYLDIEPRCAILFTSKNAYILGVSDISSIGL